LSGPFKTSAGGATYYIVYIDNHTRYTEVYFLTTKSAPEVIARFKQFQAWVQTQGYLMKRFRCDNGREEFSNAAFQGLLAEAGISYEPAPPFTQHKNGVAERMIRTLNTKARSMMLDANVPMRFWAEAVKTACYLHRRTPTSSLDGTGKLTPLEALHGTTPKLYHLRRFGCIVYKHISREQRSGRFTERSRPCMMLGYVHQTTKICRIWDFSSGPRGGAVECSDVIFDEGKNPCGEQQAADTLLPENWPEEAENDVDNVIEDNNDDESQEALHTECTYDDDDDDDKDDDDDDDDDGSSQLEQVHQVVEKSANVVYKPILISSTMHFKQGVKPAQRSLQSPCWVMPLTSTSRQCY
jgi:hypothetical protein